MTRSATTGMPVVEIERAARGYVLRTRMRLAAPIESVFAYFADAFNLEAITPPALRFQVVTPPPIEMRAGLRIDYRLRLRGLPFRWQSEITAWEPPVLFVDEQRRGPYQWWIHTHRFERDGDGVLVSDEVRYGVPGGAIAHALLVRRDLRRIFIFRERALRAAPEAAQ